MKRVYGFCVVVLALAALPAFAQDTSVNVNSFTAPELPTVPEIDGVLEDSVWAGVPTIPMDKDGDSPAADPGTGDLDITLKVAWDEETNCVYFGVHVIDESYINTAGHGSSVGANGWKNERLEIIIDGSNSGLSESNCDSGWHQQYCFDMRNIVDPWDPDNSYYGMADTPVSTEYIPVLVSEHITNILQPSEDTYPDGLNLHDDYVESAAQLKCTNPDATEWLEQPVEFVWEIKLAIFQELFALSEWGYSEDDPDLAANGFEEYLALPDHQRVDLEEDYVIGFTVQQNDSDVYNPDGEPSREHQTNTTGFDGNWNSSENLSGLILGPTMAGVGDWTLR